jgi:gluconate 2-dehydrogenase alpha chain
VATTLKEVDVVLVGMGWTGGILAKELSDAGLSVVGLERGASRSTDPDFSVPMIRDELRYAVRQELMQNAERDTISFRNNVKQTALPIRRLGSFLPGEGVGGAGVHWNGVTWRWSRIDHAIRTFYEERYGADFVPGDMVLQDWGISYEELEPYYDRFERVAGVSGRAGNVRGELRPGGNVFEGVRQSEYPLPPLEPAYSNILFTEAAQDLGYHPFPQPAANASEPYTNPYGLRLARCQYCGHCERFGCEANAKGSPHNTVIPAAMRNASFELRTQSWVTRINSDPASGKATGVSYTSMTNGEEYEQPAGIVILCAYAINNVHLMLLSGIGKPYDPVSNSGVVGKSYCYQVDAGVTLFFGDRLFNPFMAAGALGAVCDDFHANEDFDRAAAGFIGGGTVRNSSSGGRPIQSRAMPPGTPRWGAGWKQATAQWYGRSMNVRGTVGNMPNRYNYYDLDPTYRNALGQPLMRLTYDFVDNDRRAAQFMAEQAHRVARVLNPDILTEPRALTGSYSIVPYQSTHNTGGTILGATPAEGVVNRYLQSWDLHNLFVMGASVFPHNSAYNPTGPVGALAYWAADAIVNRYRHNPGPLV